MPGGRKVAGFFSFARADLRVPQRALCATFPHHVFILAGTKKNPAALC